MQGQYNPNALKCQRLRESIGKDIIIEADGGINSDTIAVCSEAGIDICVSGTGVFKADDASKAIAELKEKCK